MMMNSILNHEGISIAAALTYLALGAHFWNSRWNAANTSSVKPISVAERSAIGVAALLHGLGLYDALFAQGIMHFSFGLALSLMLWMAIVVYWTESFRFRLEGMLPLVLGLAAFCVAIPLFFPRSHVMTHSGNIGFRFHFLAAMAAYGLFAVSAVHVVFMRLAEKKLHRRSISKALNALPPILAMETMLFRMVGIAFALLTIALVTGIAFSDAIYGKPLGLDHKTVFAIASWAIFAALLIGRKVSGWRGKTAQHWLLSGFATLLLAYVGSRFVVDVLLAR